MDATSRMDVISKELSGEKNLVSWARIDLGGHSNPRSRFRSVFVRQHRLWFVVQRL